MVGNNNEFVSEYHFQVDSRLLPVNNADDTKELVDAAGSTYTVTVPRKDPGAGSREDYRENICIIAHLYEKVKR